MSGGILREILDHKRAEVRRRRARRSRAELEAATADLPETRGFVSALKQAVAAGGDGVIAEVKKASPSRGVIRARFHPVGIAESYAAAGATCLSVLTDEKYFQGRDSFLTDIRQAVGLPLLRKEFIVDAWQIPESRLIGADCILLIVAALSPAELADFHGQAREAGLDVLMEVHDEAELETALALSPEIIGINNRNLKTFETGIHNTLNLLPAIPGDVLVVTESGIHSAADVGALRERGVRAFLVGEAFMRAEDPGAALQALFA